MYTYTYTYMHVRIHIHIYMHIIYIIGIKPYVLESGRMAQRDVNLDDSLIGMREGREELACLLLPKLHFLLFHARQNGSATQQTPIHKLSHRL